MKFSTTSWMRLPAASLSLLLLAATAFAQDNAPLAENSGAPGMLPEYATGQVSNPDVFYNFYPNSYAGATSAQLYLAPRPVPAMVGHTYYTYQPLMPHEYLYAHKRVYYTPYAGADAFYQGGPYAQYPSAGNGVNKTTVTWYSGAYHFGAAPCNVFPMENLRRLGANLRAHCQGGHCGGNCR